MQSQLFTFPEIDAVAFSIGPLDIRWYALSYITGIILGWLFLRMQIKAGRSVLSKPQLDSLLNSSILGIIIGGRLGYVIFYNPSLYFAEPLAIFRVWEGGMSFHGGMIGVIGAILLCAHRFHLKPLALGDEIGVIAPIGLFFGRIANFINGELFGRVTSHPFGIVFPRGGPDPRHPSQLYEAIFEGAILFIFLLILARIKRHAGLRDGVILFGFLAGYGLARFCIEFVREPDRHIGFIAEADFLSITMGQILTLPMIFIGIAGMMMTIRTRSSSRGA